MGENKYKKSETAARVSHLNKSDQMDHRDRKSGPGAEKWAKDKKARNAERPYQIWTEPVLNTKGEAIISGFWTNR
jgi:hypothetical protein